MRRQQAANRIPLVCDSLPGSRLRAEKPLSANHWWQELSAPGGRGSGCAETPGMGNGEKGSVPVGRSRPRSLAPPGMEVHWHEVVPGAFLTRSCLTCAQLLWALAVGPGANH